MFVWKVWKLISLLKINLYMLFDLRYFVRTCFWPVFLGFALEFSIAKQSCKRKHFFKILMTLFQMCPFFRLVFYFFPWKNFAFPAMWMCLVIQFGKKAQENKTFLKCCFFYSVPCSIPEKLLGFFLMQIWTPFQLLGHLAQRPPCEVGCLDLHLSLFLL